jgi:putative Ca2+/H+ antiporter (TMEM165/GDT1 family)
MTAPLESVSLESFLVSCGLVAAAEMGDKTQLLSFMLASRLQKPWAILAGIVVATLLNHALAGSVGYLLGGWLSRTVLLWVTGLAFILFGLWALHPDSLDEKLDLRGHGAFAITAIAFFLAEMGDKTQLATVALAARFQAPLPVILGTTAGMLVADVPAIWIGSKLRHRVPMKALRIAAAALFLVLGVVTLLGLMKGNS